MPARALPDRSVTAVVIVTAAEKMRTRASGETITPSDRFAPYTVGMNRLMTAADVRPKL